jgi:hypothetical protein
MREEMHGKINTLDLENGQGGLRKAEKKLRSQTTLSNTRTTNSNPAKFVILR